MIKRSQNLGSRIALMVLLILALFFTGLPKQQVSAEESAGTIAISVEKFTIGQGYVVEPQLMTISENESWESVLKRIPELEGRLVGNSSSGSGFYLEGIEGADNGQTTISDFILGLNGIGSDVTKHMVNEDAPYLSEFSYGSGSGWVYWVWDVFPDVGLSARKAQDGDVCRLQYTVYADTSDMSKGDTSRDINRYKNKLTLAMAQANAVAAADRTDTLDQAYASAKKVAENYEATFEETDNATENLLAAIPKPVVDPESITLDYSSLELREGDTPTALQATVSPAEASQKVTWSSDNAAVATVDEEGKVTPVKAGEATITAATENGLTQSCKVVVIRIPLTGITLNRESLFFEVGDTFSLQVSYQPENTTDSKTITFSSSNPEVASVDEQGEVTGKAEGEATITAATEGGHTAATKVTVANSEAIAQAMIDKINALPEPEKMQREDISRVKEAESAYNTLADNIKALIPQETVKKLNACVNQANILIADQNAADEINSLITALPASANITLADTKAVENARNGYNTLTPAQQALVPPEKLQKLLDCEARIAALIEEDKKAAMIVEGRIADLPTYEALTLKDNPEVVDARKAYEGLTETQRPHVKNYTTLEKAEKKMRFLVNEAVAAVDLTKPVDPSSEAVADFITAMNAFDTMTESEKASFTESDRANMTKVQQSIKAVTGTDNGVSIDMAWHIDLSAKDATGIQKANLKKALDEKQKTETSEIKSLYQLGFKNLKNGESWQSDTPLTITIPILEGFDTMVNPMVVCQTLTQDGKTAIELPAVTKDTENKTLSFTAKNPVLVGVANVPIPLTGLTFSESKVTVNKNSTYQLSVKAVPENTTDNTAVTWRSANTGIATVDSTGRVSGISDGETEIIAVSKINDRISAACHVTVMTGAIALNPSADTVISETAGYILAGDTNPDLSSQWNVIGLMRSGVAVPQSYIDTFYNNAAGELAKQGGKLTTSKYTEYSKLILSMTAIGKDARNIDGYNLLSYLADFNKVKKQGFNGPVWALIASNCRPDYDIPTISGVSEQTTKAKLINYILEGEMSGGGWALQGTTADVDITAMAIQALAPYYNKDTRVTAAVDRALSVLSGMQNPLTGGFSTMGTENSESTDQVIVALTSLGINPAKDPRFVKNGHWTVEALFGHYVAGGGFMHVKAAGDNSSGVAGGTVNGMATEQGLYATAAYRRLLENKTALYDMSDLQNLVAGGHGTGGSASQGTARMQSGSSSAGAGASGSKLAAGKISTTSKITNAAADQAFNPWSFEGNFIPRTDTASTRKATADVTKGVLILIGVALALSVVFIGGPAMTNSKWWKKL